MPESDHLLRRLAFTAPGVDRAALSRGDAERIAGFLSSGQARLLPVWKQRHLITGVAEGAPRAAYLSADRLSAEDEPIFLGLVDDVPWFALGLGEDGETGPDLGLGEFLILNDVVTLLPPVEASLLAYARGMVIWHFNHRHCGRCGTATTVTEAGHSRTCLNPDCGHRAYPRTDPAVITLIVHPDGKRVLMGRQARWAPGMYSIIAGFVEPGETLEATVIRETMEETGIQVTDVRYIGSQPWPFPTSIMLGFRARAVTTEIRLDDDELEDCRWFTKDDVRGFGEVRGPGDGFKLPNPYSISRFLIDSWLNETD